MLRNGERVANGAASNTHNGRRNSYVYIGEIKLTDRLFHHLAVETTRWIGVLEKRETATDDPKSRLMLVARVKIDPKADLGDQIELLRAQLKFLVKSVAEEHQAREIHYTLKIEGLGSIGT